jgi:hypothetical protein
MKKMVNYIALCRLSLCSFALQRWSFCHHRQWLDRQLRRQLHRHFEWMSAWQAPLGLNHH